MHCHRMLAALRGRPSAGCHNPACLAINDACTTRSCKAPPSIMHDHAMHHHRCMHQHRSCKARVLAGISPGDDPTTEKQKELLQKLRVAEEDIPLTKGDASKMIERLIKESKDKRTHSKTDSTGN